MKKKMLSIICVLLMNLSLAACANSGTEQSESITPDQDIVILYTNDVHCGVDEGMGYAGVAALEEQFVEGGAETILVDCGDAVQGGPIGTLSEGEYIIDIMNELDYDVATIGNHEFDYGSERFMELAEMADFPYVSCNFRYTENDELVFDAYEMMEVAGVKIAFVGICTPYSLTSSAPVYFQDENGEYIYHFDQDEDGSALFESVQTAVDAAKKEGADYVIALSHLGMDPNAEYLWESTDVIENTTGIDVVLDGHSHSVVPCDRMKNKDGEWVLLSQTGTKFAYTGMLLIQENGSLSTGLIENVVEVDAKADAFVKGIQSELEEVLQEVVAQSDVLLTTTDPETGDRLIRNTETNMGDFCTDAYRLMTGADVALLNGGGIRANIEEGDVTYEDILNVHPYGNAICVVEATGQEILDTLESGAAYYPEENGSFMQVSGMTYEIDTTIPSSVVYDEDGMFVSVDGEYRVKNVMIGGKPLEPDKTYTLTSHDYMIKNGGDGIALYQDNVLLQDSVMLDNQVLIEYITDYLGGVIGDEYANVYGEGRITIK